MSVVERLLEEIDDQIMKFRSENAKMPKYLVLSMEHRQAIKIMYDYPDIVEAGVIKTLYGIPVIHKEDAIIV